VIISPCGRFLFWFQTLLFRMLQKRVMLMIRDNRIRNSKKRSTDFDMLACVTGKKRKILGLSISTTTHDLQHITSSAQSDFWPSDFTFTLIREDITPRHRPGRQVYCINANKKTYNLSPNSSHFSKMSNNRTNFPEIVMSE
jgi:hypothetical protein